MLCNSLLLQRVGYSFFRHNKSNSRMCQLEKTERLSWSGGWIESHCQCLAQSTFSAKASTKRKDHPLNRLQSTRSWSCFVRKLLYLSLSSTLKLQPPNLNIQRSKEKLCALKELQSEVFSQVLVLVDHQPLEHLVKKSLPLISRRVYFRKFFTLHTNRCPPITFHGHWSHTVIDGTTSVWESKAYRTARSEQNHCRSETGIQLQTVSEKSSSNKQRWFMRALSILWIPLNSLRAAITKYLYQEADMINQQLDEIHEFVRNRPTKKWPNPKANPKGMEEILGTALGESWSRDRRKYELFNFNNINGQTNHS